LKFDKVEVSGLIVLFAGVILLAATFFNAYIFLIGKVSILASVDLTELFGRALAPLIEAIIHILYLGVMGWIGSILTIRAVQLVKKEKEPIATQPQVKLEAKQPAPTVIPVPPAPPTTKATKAEQKSEAKEPKKVETTEKPQIPEEPKEPEKKVEETKPAEQTVESIA